MFNTESKVRSEFSGLGDSELADYASKIANESSENAKNPGLCIMLACQGFVLDKKRTPSDLSKTLREFSDTCKDKAFKLSMVKAADGFDGKK